MLLTMVDTGLSTAYELRAKAGMAGSLTVRPLHALMKAGFLSMSTGPLNSKRYAITPDGRAKLRGAIQSDSKEPSWLGRYGLFESVARVAFLKCLHPTEELCSQHIQWAIDELRTRSAEKNTQLAKCEREISRQGANVSPGLKLRWMKAITYAALLKGQIEALEVTSPLLLTKFLPACKAS